MLKSEDMWSVFEHSIKDYHKKDLVDQEMVNPFPKNSEKALLYQKNWIDTVQWHLEDIIRDPQIQAENALKIKRRIDASNQERTDLVEKLDEVFLEPFQEKEPKSTARLNSESPGWAIDRLSILALKIYHMEIEASREDISEELLNKNQFKLNVLSKQKEDLCLAINQLIEDLASGDRVAKVYKQMKMYNDPELNPVLYKK